jgi:dephospho-CoA kinase
MARANAGSEKIKIPSFAFTGVIASGKSTYSDTLKESLEKEFGVTVYRLSFSAKITDIIRDLFGIEEEGMAFREKYRPLMQIVGTKMKEIDPAVFSNYLIRDIKKNNKFPFIVDGLRSKEESDALKEAFADFIVIRIDSDPQKRSEAYKKTYGHYLGADQSNNITELTMATITPDFTLFNNYELSDLKKQIATIVKAIKDGKVKEMIKQSQS